MLKKLLMIETGPFKIFPFLHYADLLEVEPGAPLMVFERRSTSRGRPVEVATSWYRADRYSLQMHLAAR